MVASGAGRKDCWLDGGGKAMEKEWREQILRHTRGPGEKTLGTFQMIAEEGRAPRLRAAGGCDQGFRSTEVMSSTGVLA